MVNKVKKAPDGLPEVGFLLGAYVMAKKAIIYHENFVNFEEKIKKTRYKDFNEMIDDGWRAD